VGLIDRILVIGNYPADRQQSMARFADLLARLYSPCAQVLLVKPVVVFGGLPGSIPFLRKYLAYIDKLFLFPLWLVLHSRSYRLVHIADHGNAFYSFCCPPKRCTVTCHDLLAVRGALGDSSIACEASPIGIWLQRLVMAGLRHAGALTFVSKASYGDYLRLCGAPPSQRHAVIPNPLNAPFTPDPVGFPLEAQERRLIPAAPYLLMVGSALPRKNRRLGFRLLLELGADSPYSLVVAGAPLTSTEQAFIAEHQLTSRVVEIVRPSHALLHHLYCRAHALLFPSVAEGFGWPLIEAQACGCPVIASNTTSIPEVAGDAALYSGPHDVASFVSHLRALEDPTTRSRLIRQGEINLRRYDPEVISSAYITFALQPVQSPA
jgi:glycosyltransferase involved in cell wall biosynthesis